MAGRGKKKDGGRKGKRKGGESWRQRHGLLLSFAKWGLVATVWSFFLGLCFVVNIGQRLKAQSAGWFA